MNLISTPISAATWAEGSG